MWLYTTHTVLATTVSRGVVTATPVQLTPDWKNFKYPTSTTVFTLPMLLLLEFYFYRTTQDLVLLCFYCALRQWRRGNIALIATLPVLDCLDSGCNLSRAGFGGERPPPITKNTHSTKNSQRIENVSDDTSTSLPSQLPPATVGNTTDSKSQTNTFGTPTQHFRRKPDCFALSQNLQQNSATSLTRDSDYRSILTEEDRIRLFFV